MIYMSYGMSKSYINELAQDSMSVYVQTVHKFHTYLYVKYKLICYFTINSIMFNIYIYICKNDMLYEVIQYIWTIILFSFINLYLKTSTLTINHKF